MSEKADIYNKNYNFISLQKNEIAKDSYSCAWNHQQSKIDLLQKKVDILTKKGEWFDYGSYFIYKLSAKCKKEIEGLE